VFITIYSFFLLNVRVAFYSVCLKPERREADEIGCFVHFLALESPQKFVRKFTCMFYDYSILYLTARSLSGLEKVKFEHFENASIFFWRNRTNEWLATILKLSDIWENNDFFQVFCAVKHCRSLIEPGYFGEKKCFLIKLLILFRWW
jgi:hypothetical protein